MTIIRKNDHLFLDRYKGILEGCPGYKFRQDGIFVSLDEASRLVLAVRKKPYECTDREEFDALKSAVIKLEATVAEAMMEKREKAPEKTPEVNPARFDELMRRVVGIIVDQLELVDASGVHEDSELEGDLGADELDRTEIVLAIEEQFGVAISDEEAETLTTPRKIVEFLISEGF